MSVFNRNIVLNKPQQAIIKLIMSTSLKNDDLTEAVKVVDAEKANVAKAEKAQVKAEAARVAKEEKAEAAKVVKAEKAEAARVAKAEKVEAARVKAEAAKVAKVEKAEAAKVAKAEKAEAAKVEVNKNRERVLTTNEEWEESFGNNKNTGTQYEKNVGKCILQQNDPNIVGLKNYTQDDTIGTADIGIVYKDCTIKNYSITLKDEFKKCLRNQTGKEYGVTKTEKNEIINNESFEMAMEYRRKHKGDTPNNKWRRIKYHECPGTKKALQSYAQQGSENWNNYSPDTKIEKLRKFMDLDDEEKPRADGIIFWDEKEKTINMYNWTLNINLKDYLDTYTDEFYIIHGTPEKILLRTQVKYNNGIIEGMSKKSDPIEWKLKQSTGYNTSWNVWANLSNIFRMELIGNYKLVI